MTQLKLANILLGPIETVKLSELFMNNVQNVSLTIISQKQPHLSLPLTLFEEKKCARDKIAGR